ncbi:class I SAM-dependent methyltransferase [Fictibacillus phosphorivorans]|uniref:class I SAM-dependent methyltransferase n=1 Tax=Fictibacillus phosphorivorans TaxID=1221500 RepID=UPI00203F843D|nr:class I SAM-dependent methyltransferase [Fictibacillus phosphorivorans]MCM3717942.1 class I SAM-dependent methyltransferase [Fictibacillus phosphorivorans]MCM3775391.1 class I SAM-dependent methyltransferase [Fictibacillus phosphorivorans]
MSTFKDVEKMFIVMDNSTTKIKDKLELTYLDALVETGENLFFQEIPKEYPKELINDLTEEYKKVNLTEFGKEELRKAFQLAVLKGMKEAVQPHHAMTPDAVALFTGYLVQKFIKKAEQITLLDPVTGSGNLLTAVLNQLKEKQCDVFGVEVDETLLRLAWVNANIQKHSVELFHQDVIKPLYADPVDVVVADLPVGYYPDDETAKGFKVGEKDGHTFAHHLIMEQSVNHLKDTGIGVYIVPNNLFESEQADLLKNWMKDTVTVLGLFQLPESLFKSKVHEKSILILQKNGEGAIKPKQAMLAQLPSFSNKTGLAKVMEQINEWFKTEWEREK